MVSIRRPVPRQKKKAASLCSLRNVIVLLLLAQGCRLLLRTSSSAGSTNSNTNSESGSAQQSLKSMLDTSKMHLKKDLAVLENEIASEFKDMRHKLPKLPLLGEGESNEDNTQGRDPYTDHDDAVTSQQKRQQQSGEHHSRKNDDNEHAPPPPPVQDDDVDHNNGANQRSNQAAPAVAAALEDQNLSSDSLLVLKKHGTGSTRVGFVQDFVHERSDEAFRALPLPDMSTLQRNVSQLLPKTGGATTVDTKVKACQSYVEQQPSTTTQRHRWLIQESDHCKLHTDSDTVLIAYNGANFARTLCNGQVLQPYEALHLHDDDNNNNNEHGGGDTCIDNVLPSHDIDPPVDGQGGMPPVVVMHSKKSLASDGAVDEALLETIPCNIPCKFEKDAPSNEATLFVHGTPWTLIYTDADPYFNQKAKMERLDYQRDIYYATTSLRSSVPLSAYNFEQYNLRNAPSIEWSVAKNAATSVLDSKCMLGNAGSRRHKWHGAVGVAMEVESFGSCWHNTDLGPGESVSTPEGRIALMKKNRIVLALEAGSDKDHMTSITWEALMSGAVPAYLGPSNAHEIFPSPRAAVYASGFNNWDKFAAYVKNVSESKELWESYQAWRSDEAVLSKFEQRFNFTRTSPQCRICRWAYAKKYGLGWDHQQQQVRETYIPRKFCVNKEEAQLVRKPFREVWVQRGTDAGAAVGSDESGLTCTTPTTSLPASRTTIELDHYQIERSVLHHDGVTDIDIHKITMGTSQREDVVLRLDFSPHVRNTDGAYFRNTHTLVPNLSQAALVSSASIQDENAKITILANWATTITSNEEGWMEIGVQYSDENEDFDDQAENGYRRRIRVIIEDFHPLHDKLTEFYPSSFCKTMTQDFVDPIQLFYPTS